MRFPQAETGLQSVLEAAYPVGAIFTSTVDTDPALLLGFGTWQAFAAGRCLVGLDAGQAEFDALGKTGGAKTHTLTEAQMPSHTHAQNAHNHTQRVNSGTTGGLSGYTPDTSTQTGATSGYTTLDATATNQNTGGGQPHSILQPFVTVRFWKRVS